jgi:hypothetical protein
MDTMTVRYHEQDCIGWFIQYNSAFVQCRRKCLYVRHMAYTDFNLHFPAVGLLWPVPYRSLQISPLMFSRISAQRHVSSYYNLVVKQCLRASFVETAQVCFEGTYSLPAGQMNARHG